MPHINLRLFQIKGSRTMWFNLKISIFSVRMTMIKILVIRQINLKSATKVTNITNHQVNALISSYSIKNQQLQFLSTGRMNSRKRSKPYATPTAKDPISSIYKARSRKTQITEI